MKFFKFEKSFKESLHVYSYVREHESFIEKSWRGLNDSTVSSVIQHFELMDKPRNVADGGVDPEDFKSGMTLTQKTPFNQYCINNTNREEVAVYLGLIWRLTKNYLKIAVPSYYREISSVVLERNYKEVLWEYKIENEDCYKDSGFKIGNSWSNATNRVVDGSGVFEIKSFQELVLLQNSVQSDASSNINLYCLNSQDRQEALINELNIHETPQLINILKDNEIFINLTIGSDPGYFDVLLIKSKNDIETQIHRIVTEYSSTITEYEKSVGECKTLDQFLTAIAKMIKIYPN